MVVGDWRRMQVCVTVGDGVDVTEELVHRGRSRKTSNVESGFPRNMLCPFLSLSCLNSEKEG